VSCAKTAEPIEISFGTWTRVCTRKHMLHGVRIGAAWRIRLNYRPCAAAMRPYVILLWPLVYFATLTQGRIQDLGRG